MAFEEFEVLYEEEEREIVVLRHKGGGGAKHNDFWVGSAYFLAYVDEEGRLHNKEGRLVWPVTEEESKRGGCFGKFRDETIYRIKARRLKDRKVEEGMIESFFNQFYAVQILEEDASCEALEEILEDYRTEVVIEDELLGELTLNKDFSEFEGEITWAGQPLRISLEVDTDDEESQRRTFEHMKKMVAEQEEWNEKMLDLAAMELVELANEWRLAEEEGEKKPVITKQDFITRIQIRTLCMQEEGTFVAYYDDDDMFWGHCITVYGSLEEGVETAQIEG